VSGRWIVAGLGATLELPAAAFLEAGNIRGALVVGVVGIVLIVVGVLGPPALVNVFGYKGRK
jgi:hypothetical protein